MLIHPKTMMAKEKIFLASSLGTCVITIMGIEEKRRGWELGNIQIDVYKIMTKDGLRKIKTLTLEIYMPSEKL